MAAEIIFSSTWMIDETSRDAEMIKLQDYLIDRLEIEAQAEVLVTTTRDFETGSRKHWLLQAEAQNPNFFFLSLIQNHPLGGDNKLTIYETEQGNIYARYQYGKRSSIWKFYFLTDLVDIIESSALTSAHYDDLRMNLEYGLQEAGYLRENEEMEMNIIENSGGFDFYLALPYMQESIMNGRMEFDTVSGAYILDQDSLYYDEAFDAFIHECLY